MHTRAAMIDFVSLAEKGNLYKLRKYTYIILVDICINMSQ